MKLPNLFTFLSLILALLSITSAQQEVYEMSLFAVEGGLPVSSSHLNYKFYMGSTFGAEPSIDHKLVLYRLGSEYERRFMLKLTKEELSDLIVTVFDGVRGPERVDIGGHWSTTKINRVVLQKGEGKEGYKAELNTIPEPVRFSIFLYDREKNVPIDIQQYHIEIESGTGIKIDIDQDISRHWELQGKIHKGVWRVNLYTNNGTLPHDMKVKVEEVAKDAASRPLAIGERTIPQHTLPTTLQLDLSHSQHRTVFSDAKWTSKPIGVAQRRTSTISTPLPKMVELRDVPITKVEAYKKAAPYHLAARLHLKGGLVVVYSWSGSWGHPVIEINPGGRWEVLSDPAPFDTKTDANNTLPTLRSVEENVETDYYSAFNDCKAFMNKVMMFLRNYPSNVKNIYAKKFVSDREEFKYTNSEK